jgi:hypothetical protein
MRLLIGDGDGDGFHRAAAVRLVTDRPQRRSDVGFAVHESVRAEKVQAKAVHGDSGSARRVAPQPSVVIGHSLGSVVTYEGLWNCPEVTSTSS